MKFLTIKFRQKSSEKINKRALSKILGFVPKKLDYYILAFIDPSLHKKNDVSKIATNDRLEFLGDSVLGMAVSKYLYNRYPEWSVGQLSKTKAHMVSRSVSNKVAEEIGLSQFFLPSHNTSYGKDALGNALEALIAAIYLDKGYATVARFLQSKLLPIYLREKEQDETFGHNFKGEIQALTDKNSQQLAYITKEDYRSRSNGFRSEVFIDGIRIGVGRGRSKKYAEQEAARQALKILMLRNKKRKNNS